MYGPNTTATGSDGIENRRQNVPNNELFGEGGLQLEGAKKRESNFVPDSADTTPVVPPSKRNSTHGATPSSQRSGPKLGVAGMKAVSAITILQSKHMKSTHSGTPAKTDMTTLSETPPPTPPWGNAVVDTACDADATRVEDATSHRTGSTASAPTGRQKREARRARLKGTAGFNTTIKK